MSSPDFTRLPPEYQRLLSIAREKYHLDVTPLQALSGGRTGAFLYLVSASIGDFRKVEHLIVKFDRINEKAKPTEVERHRMALSQAPALFSSQNMAKLAYEVEHEGTIALFYTIAGQSLQYFRTLASEERQSRLETLFGATNDYLLKEWNAESVFERALHPQQVLKKWLGHRLKPSGQIASFLKDTFLLDPDIEGFLIQGQIFPNPWTYGLNTGRWQGTRPIDVLTGFQHGDLNLSNILAKFAEDSEALEGYFLIDFALYKAQMPLLYDQCYLETSYLIRELERATFQKWVSLVTHFSGRDIPNPKEVPIELAGACEVINAARKSFKHWIHKAHPSLSDDLWGQFWLAAVAAGLNFCNKPALSTEERLAGLIYSSVHLKRYCTQFGIPLPVDVRLLYDAGKWGEIASINESASLSNRKGMRVQPTPLTRKAQLASGTVTFLFTDIEASTKLWEQYSEAMKAALARHYAILQEAVETHAGQVVENTGDGILAIFNTGLDGVAAALMAQQALNAERWSGIEPQAIRVRMGLHTGETEMREGMYAGPVLNRAARLMSIGHGGQTLLSTVTADLVRDQMPDGASLQDLGEHRLKDLVRSERVYQLIHPGLPADFPPLKSLNAFPNNLPVQLTSFIGRQEELKAVKDLLVRPDVRLVTLTGPGGTGKTRLSLQTAADLIDRFKDGVFFVDLAPIREPESVLAAIARTVGLRETSERPLLDELKGHLQDRIMLLLLDNFEQVTGAGSHVIELLTYCPRLRVLVTSREALHMRGEQVFPVPPLALPRADLKQPSIEQLTQFEAVRLFIERAQAVKPDFQLTDENAPAVAEICFRLDGLPLAIELATARIRLFSPQALLERLGSPLKLLRGGARDLPVRQQTLRDTINWSYELLDPGEQQLFALLSVFPNCTFEAVEGVARGIEHLNEMGTEVFDGLTSLEDKSLIRQADQDAHEPRLLMLETIREYAAERLEEDPGFSAAARRAHATYFADFTQHQWERLTSGGREAALKEMRSEIANVQTAWRYWVAEEDLEQLQKITDCLWLLYDGRGWYHAMVDLTADLLKVLAFTPSTPERAQQEIMLQTSLARALLAIKGYTEEVEQAYARALALCENAGEVPQLFPVLRGLASFYILRTEYGKAMQMGERILSLAEHLDDADMKLEGNMVLSYNLAFVDHPQAGLDRIEDAMASYDPGRQRVRRLGFGTNPGVISLTVSSLILWMLGYPDRARKRAADALMLAQKIDHPYTKAYAQFHNGLLNVWLRNPEIVQERAQAVLKLAEEHGFQIWSAVGTCLHGAALVGMGSAEKGLALIEEGINIYRILKTPPVFWPLLLYLCAGAYGAASRPEQGLRLLKEAIEFETAGSARTFVSEFLMLQGELLLALSPANATEAESAYRQAVDNAREVHAPMLELRAAMRLSRLWHEQGKTEQARELLSEAYTKMSEGFTIPDLKEAEALLADLS
ncbi:MAG TPA: adenylate/guanylate cyclase domain-containing protein [Anaerolineales bacterium]